MEIVIPYNSLIYRDRYIGGRQQYFKNLLIALKQIPEVDKFTVWGTQRLAQFIFNVCKDNKVCHRFLALFMQNGKDSIAHFPFGPGIPHPAFFGKRAVVSIHELFCDTFPSLFSKNERIRYKNIISTLATGDFRIIAVSNFLKNELIKRYSIDPERIYVVSPGCHPVHFAEYGKSLLDSIMRKYNPPPFFIFYPAAKWPHKNHINLIRAVERLRNEGFRNLNLVLSGPWGNSSVPIEALKKEISRRDWIYNIENIPHQDMAAFYRLAAITVVPSLCEGFGMPIIEAMANSCPVLCSDIGVFREVGGDAIATFNPVDPDHIAYSIARVLKNGEQRNILKEKGQKRAESFTLERVALDLRRVYQNV